MEGVQCQEEIKNLRRGGHLTSCPLTPNLFPRVMWVTICLVAITPYLPNLHSLLQPSWLFPELPVLWPQSLNPFIPLS